MPIVNTLAFLFTVLGEWWVEKKVISRGGFLLMRLSNVSVTYMNIETAFGMLLSLVGIGLCVQSKT